MEFSSLNCTDWLEIENSNRSYSAADFSHQVNKRNVAAVVFVGLMIAVGLVGNILVIIVFTLKYKKSTYRVYVLCLAFLDTLNCCFTLPFVVTYILFSQNFPSGALCKIGHFVGFYIGLASPFTLILIAFDRYRNICQPLCLQISEKKAKVYCVIVNIASLAMSWHVPVIYGNTEYQVPNTHLIVTRCYKEDNSIAQKITWWQYIILTAILVIVAVLLAVIYFIIMIRVQHKSKYFTQLQTAKGRAKSSTGNGRVSSNTSGSRNSDVSRTSSNFSNGDGTGAYVSKSIQTRKTTLTFFIITTVYVLSSVIHHALAIVLHVVPNLECRMTFIQGTVFWTFFWTIFINNIANPFIYGLSDNRFRQHLKAFFHKKKTTPLAWTTQQPFLKTRNREKK